jgi:hypothetical protein
MGMNNLPQHFHGTYSVLLHLLQGTAKIVTQVAEFNNGFM